MEIVKMKLSELNPAEYNPRKALKPGDPAYEKLKASILSFGNVEPIVWNRSTGNVIGGHQRLRVLLDLGVEESEVSVVDLSEVDEKRLNIALNKITGEWDDEKLASLLADITAGGADVFPTGFDDQELASMFADLSKATAHDDGFDLLPVQVEADTVSFPWFSGEATGDEIKAYTHLITALCDMARNQKRIIAREKDTDNDKYAFRCFLLRLGFIGAEFKEERKILLRNLTGNGAFKSGKRGTEALRPEPPGPTAQVEAQGDPALAEAAADAALIEQVNASFEAQ